MLDQSLPLYLHTLKIGAFHIGIFQKLAVLKVHVAVASEFEKSGHFDDPNSPYSHLEKQECGHSLDIVSVLELLSK